MMLVDGTHGQLGKSLIKEVLGQATSTVGTVGTWAYCMFVVQNLDSRWLPSMADSYTGSAISKWMLHHSMVATKRRCCSGTARSKGREPGAQAAQRPHSLTEQQGALTALHTVPPCAPVSLRL